jgi:enoyl-CoA hydratase/carnithine racemase
MDVGSDLDSGVLTITIDRPAARNAINYPVLDELIALFTRADEDPAVRAIVVTATGDYFSVGTDLSPGANGYDTTGNGFKPLRGGTRDVGGELALRIFNATVPVIAAINGTAIGIGVTMVLPMDVRIAADTARFGLPFARRGIVPESCATWFLPRVVGIATAVDWCVTGRVFEANEALAAGLVRQLVPASRVLEHAHAVAYDVAANTSAVSVALTRQMLWRQLGAPHPMSANRLESRALLALGAMPDAKEGVTAFRERRAPAFPSRVPGDLPDFYPWFADEPFDA